MIVPEFWAEGRIRHREGNRQVTVRRFGWSDESQDAAQAHADERAQEALRRWKQGDRTLDPREVKVPYNGADGLPIREEIVARHGDTVITRNSYGALCLNTPDVMFVDIDHAEPSVFSGVDPARISAAVVAAIALVLLVGWLSNSVWLALLAAPVPFLFLRRPPKPAAEPPASPNDQALQKVQAFAAAHPDWHVRLYETPAGLRLMVLHTVFDPASEEVAAVFRELGTDPCYAVMCRNQRCFRARLTPKPWRIGIETRLRPRPGVWPVAPERLPERQQWLAAYDAASTGYAACKFVGSFGSTNVHPHAAEVLRVHDSLSHAESALPVA